MQWNVVILCCLLNIVCEVALRDVSVKLGGAVENFDGL